MLLLLIRLKRHWSPEQVSGRLKRHKILNISHQTIYNYIWKNKAIGGKLYKYLKKKKEVSQTTCLEDKNSESYFYCMNAPMWLIWRSRIGDWEIDTIVSRKHKDVLVTFS